MVFGHKCCRSHSSDTSTTMSTVPVDGRLGQDTIKSLQIMLKAASVPRVGPIDGWMVSAPARTTSSKHYLAQLCTTPSLP